MVVFALFLGLALFQTMLVAHQQRLDRLDKEVAVEQQSYKQLQFAQAAAEAPEAIVDKATELGMVPAADTTWLAPSADAAAAAQAAGDPNNSSSAGAPEVPDGVTSESWPEIKKHLGTER
jgi:hypothetical protein